MGKDLASAFASFPALSTLDRYEWDTIDTTDDATAQSVRTFPDDPLDDDEP